MSKPSFVPTVAIRSSPPAPARPTKSATAIIGATTIAGIQRMPCRRMAGARSSGQLFSQKENPVAIRFRLPAHAMERVAHAYSPLLEAVLSLHVLGGPKHAPRQPPGVWPTRSLPAQAKREIAAFAFVYRRHVPDVFAPSPVDDLRSFEDELAALRGLAEGRVGLGSLRS